MGVNSLAERELKDQKEMKNKLQIEQYLIKFPESEKHLGFENDSNVCYINSAIQMLYQCVPFRTHILLWKP